MTDYTKLVEDLRHGVGYWYMQNSSRLVSILGDAADAIEALQAEVPKRGEWIATKYHTWECSVCGKNPTTGMGYVQTRKALYNYCPNCGAKMEVQK